MVKSLVFSTPDQKQQVIQLMLEQSPIKHLTPVSHHINQADRERRQSHRGAVIWLTGLSGSGKSTLAMNLESSLFKAGCNAYVLDGDNVRHGLNSDLGFSDEDRHENIRRIGEVAALFAHAGIICITSFISPFKEDRHRARCAAKKQLFCEIHVNASLEECEKRDPKGLYQKARAGFISDMTGINSPYEYPEAADLVINTANDSIENCSEELLKFVWEKTRLPL